MTITRHEASAVLAELNQIIIDNSWSMLDRFITHEDKWNMILRLLEVAEKARKSTK